MLKNKLGGDCFGSFSCGVVAYCECKVTCECYVDFRSREYDLDIAQGLRWLLGVSGGF